jgi:cytochrome c oxidase subunit 2
VIDTRHEFGGLFSIYEWLTVGVAAVVVGAVMLALIRYRSGRRGPPNGRSEAKAGESVYAVVLAVIAAGLVAATFHTESRVDPLAANAKLRIRITAFDWQWRFDYPDNGVSIVGTRDSDPEIVVPVNVPVSVTLDAVDVNHSFYVPLFLFKRDAIPGMTNRFDFTVEAAGTYRGQCAEFCGVFHDAMLFSVRAVSASEFEQWVAGQAHASLPPPPLIGPAPYPSGR